MLSWTRILLVPVACLFTLIAGCQSPGGRGSAVSGVHLSESDRAFRPDTDILGFSNGLLWSYTPDGRGGMIHKARDPKPDFALRCFAMVRLTRQFQLHSRFDPTAEVPSESELRQKVSAVLGRSVRTKTLDSNPVLIPGYSGLRELSAAHPDWFKQACGGAWRSYFHRGNWRVVFPFSRKGQDDLAQRIEQDVRKLRTVPLHILKFPSTSINHAVLVYAARSVENGGIDFDCYDPNTPGEPLILHWKPGPRSFWLDQNHYFLGGPVDAYVIDTGLCF